MFTVEYVKDLKWCDAEHTFIDCIVKYAEMNEEMPCGVNGIDPYSHIQEIWAKANAGEYGAFDEYIPPPVFGPPPEIVPAPEEQQPTTEGTQEL